MAQRTILKVGRAPDSPEAVVWCSSSFRPLPLPDGALKNVRRFGLATAAARPAGEGEKLAARELLAKVPAPGRFALTSHLSFRWAEQQQRVAYRRAAGGKTRNDVERLNRLVSLTWNCAAKCRRCHAAGPGLGIAIIGW